MMVYGVDWWMACAIDGLTDGLMDGWIPPWIAAAMTAARNLLI